MATAAGFRASIWIGRSLTALALLVNVVLLWPEQRIGTLPLNDALFHRAASERLTESFANREPFFDPWVSEWSLGYPVWRSYQPLPHLLAGAIMRVAPAKSEPSRVFAGLQMWAVALLPLSVFAGARLFGLSPPAAGLAALLVLTPSGIGELSGYGIGYSAYVWRGRGLFTQSVALHFVVLGLGVARRFLDDEGSRRVGLIGGALLLAGTTLSHIVFGYVAFASIGICAVSGPRVDLRTRLTRLLQLYVLSGCLLAWFVVPLWLSLDEVNHSRWESPHKWDSFGAGFLLPRLLFGTLLDAFRPRVLSLMLAVGGILAVWRIREPVPRRLLTLALFWLVLFFGRASLGDVVDLLLVPADLHMHRLQGAFELFAVVLGAWGTVEIIATAARWRRSAGVLAATILLAGIGSVYQQVFRYLSENRAMGEDNRVSYVTDQKNLDAALASVRAILAERPGRASAGKSATWGRDFKVGSMPVYSFLTREHLDQVSFLYHAMSLTSDVLVVRDEQRAAHDSVFAVRAVIAPASLPALPHWRPRGRHGRFAVYEVSNEGYFGLVDLGGHWNGPHERLYDTNATWLAGEGPESGIVVALNPQGELPKLASPDDAIRPRGRILRESKVGEIYCAEIEVERPCLALVKITWFPDLVATIDGRTVPLLRVTPGFGAVAVRPGDRVVEVRYVPGSLKAWLFAGGALAFVVLSAVVSGRLLRAANVDPATSSQPGSQCIRGGSPADSVIGPNDAS